ncbi:MAG: PTS sugar transporter subunit IIA [bacterium]
MNLTVRDAASLLQVSEKTIYRWIQKGVLPAYRVQDQYRFTRGELLQWAASRRVNPTADVFHEPPDDQQPLSRLREALERGMIYYRVEGRDKKSVLRNMIDMLRIPEGLDRDFLHRAVLAREDLASTGIGNGIAVPHARYPAIHQMNQPLVSLFFTEHPIDFGAVDGQPVSTLFLLVSPTVRGHLHLLSRLFFLLRNAAFTRLLQEQSSREQILSFLEETEECMNSTTRVS